MKKFKKGCLTTLIILLLVVILVIAALIIFRNPIAKFVIEKAGSSAAGAKVEVDGVYLKPLALHITWDRMQFTDKADTWKNLFETGKCEFEMEFKPLLAGKVLINKMQVEAVRFDTERSTDGALGPVGEKREPSKLMQMVKANLEREKNRIPVFDPKFLKTEIDVMDLLEEFNFQTPAKADSIKDLAEDRYAYWENLIENNDYEERVKTIESDIKNIDLEEMDNLLEIQQNLTLALNTYNNTVSLYDDFTTQKEQVEIDLVRLKTLYKDVPDWIRSDYDNALELAKLPDVSVQKIALMLFGDRVTEGIMLVLDKIEKARELAETQPESNKKEKMPHLPAFWIKEISLTAYPGEDLLVNGKILDISSDQKKTNRPIDIDLAGFDEKLGDLKIKGLFDHRTDMPRDVVNIVVNEVPVRDMQLANFDLLPTKLNKGTAKLFANLNISKDLIKVAIGFEAEDIQFDYTSQPDMDARLVQVSRTVSEAIDTITFDASVKQKTNNFTFSISSNLDELISTQLKKVVQNEINRAKNEIRSRVNSQLDKYRHEAEDLINHKNAELQQKIGELTSLIDEQKAKIDAKKQELEDRIEAEKQKLEDEAAEELEGQLQDLLNKLKQ